MKNIKLITDGSCDLSQKIIEDSKVDIVDVMVSFGENGAQIQRLMAQKKLFYKKRYYNITIL